MIHKTNFPVLVASLLILGGCGQKNAKNAETKETAIPVRTEQVGETTVKGQISASGNVEGNTTVRLSFLVGGRLNYISNHEGQNVSKGRLIASLDPENYKIAKQLSDVQVANTTDEFNRLTILHDRNSLSENDYSKIIFSLQQAKLQQQLQQKNLNDTKLYTPISGVLIKKKAEAGEIVGVGTPLFVISDIRTVKVVAYIPEDQLHFIRMGQNVNVSISALNKIFTGKVIEVGADADETSRAFTIKIIVDNPDLLIRPGMIADETINTNLPTQKILLPAESIGHDLNNQDYVYVIDKSQSKAFKHKINIGNMIDNKIEVTNGLNPDDLVVVEGQSKLVDGSLITIK